MDALVQAFLVAALCEAGSRTGLLAAALALRFRRSGAIVAGIAIAAALNMGLAAAAGSATVAVVPHSGIRLLTGLSLLLAGGSALFPPGPAPAVAGWRLGPLLSAAGAFFILALGDRGQFAVGAIAAATGAPILAAVGGAAGVVAASLPAVLFAERWAGHPAQRPVRITAAGALLLSGAVVLVVALQIA